MALWYLSIFTNYSTITVKLVHWGRQVYSSEVWKSRQAHYSRWMFREHWLYHTQAFSVCDSHDVRKKERTEWQGQKDAKCQPCVTFFRIPFQTGFPHCTTAQKVIYFGWFMTWFCYLILSLWGQEEKFVIPKRNVLELVEFWNLYVLSIPMYFCSLYFWSPWSENILFFPPKKKSKGVSRGPHRLWQTMCF